MQSQLADGHMGMHQGMAQDPGMMHWEGGPDDEGAYQSSFALADGVSR